MDEKSLAYFSSINPLARKIIKDERNLKYAVKQHWDDLNWHEQETLIDDFVVDNSVRERYAHVAKLHSYAKSFPKFQVETGEKIVVDFENDFWTWQDEHSAPFNWRTKSQQDLTLEDLEPEVLCSKVKKTDPINKEPIETDNEKTENREFSVQTGTSIWDSPFLQGMKKPDFINRSRSTSPVKSSASKESLMTSRSKSPEEVNYAFSGSMDDVSCSPSQLEERSISVSSGEVRTTSPSGDEMRGTSPFGEEMRGTSPSQETSPIKPARRKRSVSKSPAKSVISYSKRSESDTGSHSLFSAHVAEDNAFDNPALGNDWSRFVNNQEEEELSSATPSPYKSLLKEPEPVGMDRGETSNQSGLLTGFQDDFQDEILVVESPTDDADNFNASSLSKTGFDFLDNW